jgi:hypothetical protein
MQLLYVEYRISFISNGVLSTKNRLLSLLEVLPIVPLYNTVGVMYDEEKIFCTGPTKAAKAEQKSFVPALQAQRTNQGRPPFTLSPHLPHAVSTVNRGHPTVISLGIFLDVDVLYYNYS